MNRFLDEIYSERVESKDLDKIDQDVSSEKSFFWKENKVEMLPEVEEKLHEIGIESVDLSGTKEIWQRRIVGAVESMLESHPEIKGVIGSIKTTKLQDGVYACAGPRMTEHGISSEIQLNEKLFSKSNLEMKIVDMEAENFKGEKWLAGRGLDGVLKHEMAHIMHLKMIADKEGISFGDTDKDKFDLLAQQFYRNAMAVTMCNDSIKELGISPRDIGKELSTYGASDFGEFFAEAISECETSKKPRPLASKVYEKYNEYLENKEVLL